MIEQTFENMLEGITLIDDDTGAIGGIISRQFGKFASSAGKKVCFLRAMNKSDGSGKTANNSINELSTLFEGLESMILEEKYQLSNSNLKSLTTVSELEYFPLEKLKFDVIIIESFSSYLFGKSESEVIELTHDIRLLADQQRCFVILIESSVLDSKVAAYLRSISDNVIIVKTELNDNRIDRSLYIPKMRNGRVFDKLLKITVEQDNIEIDTREYVG
jgi:archaellum biogenesis ATPase FlaH